MRMCEGDESIDFLELHFLMLLHFDAQKTWHKSDWETHLFVLFRNHGTPFLMCLVVFCLPSLTSMFAHSLFYLSSCLKRISFTSTVERWRWRWRRTKWKSKKKLIAIQFLLAQIIFIQEPHQMSWFRASQVGAHTSPFFTPFSGVQLYLYSIYLAFSLFQFVRERVDLHRTTFFFPLQFATAVCLHSICCVCSCVCMYA